MARRRGGGYRTPVRRVGIRLPSIPRAAIQPVSRLGSPRTNTVNAVTNMLAVRGERLAGEQAARQQFEQRLVEAGIKAAMDAAQTKSVYTLQNGQLLNVGNVPQGAQVINQTSAANKPLDPVAEGLRVAQMQQRLVDIRKATEEANRAITTQNLNIQDQWKVQQPGGWDKFWGAKGTPEPTGIKLVDTPDTTTLDQTLKYGTQRLGGLMGQGAAVPAAATDDPIVRTGIDQDSGRRVGLTRSGKLVPLE